MVKIIKKGEKVLYECEECGFRYVDKNSAEECETWCGDHHNCNVKITRKAVENNEHNENHED